MKFLDNKKAKALASPGYNYIFDKETGFFARWGKTKQDDPDFSPVGPEIADIEISAGQCSKRCKFCSPPGTEVSTLNGEVNIEDIKEGDYVVSYNMNSNGISTNEVKEVYQHEYTGEIIEIELDNNKVLKLTPDHEVFTKRGWIAAGSLSEEDELLDI